MDVIAEHISVEITGGEATLLVQASVNMKPNPDNVGKCEVKAKIKSRDIDPPATLKFASKNDILA